MNNTKISIVIVNYNVKYFLEQCLYAIRSAGYKVQGGVEIFVVDNHSTDGSVAYLQPKFPEVIFIENNNNPGFAKANNQAIHQCKGEYILLLNPDTVIGEDCLHNMCCFMDEHHEAGAAGVKMLNAHGMFLPESKRSFPTPWVSCCKLFGLSNLLPHSPRFAAYSLPYLNPDKQHQVDVLAGAFLFIRHAVLKKAGLFDESFFMYGEDIDLSYRIKMAGYQNYYFPERILHYKGESTKKGDSKYLHAFYDAMLIFYRKYYPHSGWFISTLIRLSIMVRKGYAALFERKYKEKKKKQKRHRTLIICNETHFEKVKTSISESTYQHYESENPNSSLRRTKQSTYQHYRLLPASCFADRNDDTSVLDSMNQSIQMEKYTDIVCCYPDISFAQMLLLMDKIHYKSITYHIFHLNDGLLISPNH